MLDFEFVEEISANVVGHTPDPTKTPSKKTGKTSQTTNCTPNRALYLVEAARIRIKYDALGRTFPPCPAQLSAESREFRALDESIAALTPRTMPVTFDTRPPVGIVLQYLPRYNGK